MTVEVKAMPPSLDIKACGAVEFVDEILRCKHLHGVGGFNS